MTSIASVHARARYWTPAATRRWKSKCELSEGTAYWGARSCRAALRPASTRRWSCAMATSRDIWARGCLKAVTVSERDHCARGDGAGTPIDQKALDELMLAAGWHGDQEQAWGRMRSWACRWRWRARPPTVCVCRLYAYSRRRPRARIADPDDEYHERRQACVEGSTDFQEFMVMPTGRAEFPRSAALGHRDLSPVERQFCTSEAYQTTVGDEGGFAPSLGSNQAALDVIMEAIDKSGFSRRATRFSSRLTRRLPRLYRRRQVYKLDIEGRSAKRGRDGRVSGATGAIATRSFPSKTAWTRMTGRTGRGWWQRSVTGCRSSAMTLLVTNVDKVRRAITERAANALLLQSQPNRHA